jgi:hypothetical protein
VEQQEPSRPSTPIDLCTPTPCGPNTKCRVSGGRPICSCLPDFYGNPLSGCRPECVLNSDCSRHLACSNNKCVDPCLGSCGTNARCEVNNHNAICYCPSHMTGDPFVECKPFPTKPSQPG